MEVLGTVAATADLIGLSIRASKAAKDVVKSFINAPSELVELETKLDRLRASIQQVHSLTEGLCPTSASSGLLSNTGLFLPPEHREILSQGLQTSLGALQKIKSLCDAKQAVTGGKKPGSREDVKRRIRWATLDKRKASRILKEVELAEAKLNHILTVLGVRLASLNKTSLSHIIASQATLHADLKDSVKSIKGCIEVEVRNLVEQVSIQDNNRDSDRCRPCDRSGSLSKYPRPVSKAYGIETRKDDEIIDPGTRLMEHNRRRTLVRYSARFGDCHELIPATPEHGTTSKLKIGGSISFESKQNRRKIKMTLSVGFKLICNRILRFEIEAQQTCLRWAIFGGPKVGGTMRIFNVRPLDAPIFEACLDLDFDQVMYLLESGQASLYDVSEERGGLLEHLVQDLGPWSHPSNKENKEVIEGRRIIEYLLDQGCDPNAFYGKFDSHRRMPAVLVAFKKGQVDYVSTMMSHGADLLRFSSTVGGLFEFSERTFSWKVQLLRSIGFSDWKMESRSIFGADVLDCACWMPDIDEILFALEVAGIDPNPGKVLKNTPLGIASNRSSVRASTVLLEYGAKVNVGQGVIHSPPLSLSFFLSDQFLKDTSHHLLSKGADLLLTDLRGRSTWQKALSSAVWHDQSSAYRPILRDRRLYFIDVEGGLAHLLWHNADPFELFLAEIDFEPGDFGAASFGRAVSLSTARQTRAIQIAQLCSYVLEGPEPLMEGGLGIDWWLPALDDVDDGKYSNHHFAWAGSGIIYPLGLEEVATSRSGSVCNVDDNESDNDDSDDDDPDASASGDDENKGPERLYDEFSPIHRRGWASPNFFRNATRFYHHISTEEGRRQLSRFPMVRALCDALQHAGYRAEMDDDGDIWYEDEDGDRYFDAREYQPTEDRADWLVGECPICRDLEGYGLGNIKKEEEEGKRLVREYKEKVREAKSKTRNYF